MASQEFLVAFLVAASLKLHGARPWHLKEFFEFLVAASVSLSAQGRGIFVVFRTKEDAATINRGIFMLVGYILLVANSRPAEDSSKDVTNAATVIRSVATIVAATILAKTCVIALHETISKSL